MTMRRLLAVLALLLPALGFAEGPTAGNRRIAKAAVREGGRCFRSRNYACAAERYREAFSAVAVGVALIGVGAFFGFQARNASAEAQDCQSQVPWPESCFDAVDRHDRLVPRAYLLIGLGGGLATAGGIWAYFLHGKTTNGEASLRARIAQEEASLVYQRSS